MSSIILFFGDGVHNFRLPIGQLRELQEKCASGPQRILQRLSSLDWKIDDIRETLRLGLIGGGSPPATAYALVVRYIDEREEGLLENRQTAQVILMKALVGDPSDPVGEPQTDQTTVTEASNLAASTAGES